MGLLERDDELAALGDALAAARAGERATVGLLGEPGIGKSALLAETAARAREAGLLVLDGRA
ncbi:MAG TPA: AAA family ATPase, partial [Capillimicrobium sp.]